MLAPQEHAGCGDHTMWKLGKRAPSFTKGLLCDSCSPISSCDVNSSNVHCRHVLCEQTGLDRGRWGSSPPGQTKYGCAWLSCRMALIAVGTGWPISLLFCTNRLRKQSSHLVRPPFGEELLLWELISWELTLWDFKRYFQSHAQYTHTNNNTQSCS